MKYLFVGDPHATVEALPECRRLVEYIVQIAKQEKVYEIVLLGDLYHTHAVMRVEVMDFWRWAFEKMKEACWVVTALVGNHDMPGNGTGAHSLLAHIDTEGISVVDSPCGGLGISYFPYMADQQ